MWFSQWWSERNVFEFSQACAHWNVQHKSVHCKSSHTGLWFLSAEMSLTASHICLKWHEDYWKGLTTCVYSNSSQNEGKFRKFHLRLYIDRGSCGSSASCFLHPLALTHISRWPLTLHSSSPAHSSSAEPMTGSSTHTQTHSCCVEAKGLKMNSGSIWIMIIQVTYSLFWSVQYI